MVNSTRNLTLKKWDKKTKDLKKKAKKTCNLGYRGYWVELDFLFYNTIKKSIHN
jgi:hypothetical protein